MKKSITLAVALSVAATGCATTGTMLPGSTRPADKATVASEQKQEARRSAVRAGAKGCATGAAMGILGGLLGGGFNAKTVLAGCVVAGATTGLLEYQSQLADFRALQGKVSVGAVSTVKEKDVVVDGKPAKAAENLSLNLDAKKVAARSADIVTVIDELAKVLNKQTMAITVSVAGNPADRYWIDGQLRGRVNNDKVKLVIGAGSAPVIVVSPVPAIK